MLFTRDGSLVAQAFDMKTLSLAGDATQIVERVASIRPLYAQAWVSNSGALVYRIPESPRGTPAFFDRTGRRRGGVPGISDAPALHPRLSPDGTRLAIFIAGDLWVYDLAGRPPVRLTSRGQGYSPLWTQDGKRIIYEKSGSVGLRQLPGRWHGRGADLGHASWSLSSAHVFERWAVPDFDDDPSQPGELEAPARSARR